MGPIAFESKTEFIPLQAADMVVYETYKNMTNKLARPDFPVRKSISRIAQSTTLVARYYEREGLDRLLAKLRKDAV